MSVCPASLQVDLYVDLTLPACAENKGLFQLRSILKSDAGAVLHTAQRPLALPHRSPLVATLRDVVLFPLYLLGFLPESMTLRHKVAESLVQTQAAPLAAAEVVVTGARPMHVPPVIHGGTLSVDVRLSAPPLDTSPLWMMAAVWC